MSRQNKSLLQTTDPNISLLLTGSPGTGKTTALEERFLFLSHAGDPSRVLYLGLSHHAVEASIARVAASSVAQWHGSFCFVAAKLLRLYGSAIGLDSFTIIDVPEAKELLSQARPSGCKIPKDLLYELYSFCLYSQKPLADVVAETFPDETVSHKQAATIFSSYAMTKREMGIVDNEDLLILWLALFDNPVGQALPYLFDHILLDEYQNCTPLENMLVHKMCGPATSLTAAGDVTQNIYQFKGNYGSNPIKNFAAKPSTRRIVFETNHRSTPAIEAVAEAVLDPDIVVNQTIFSVRDRPKLVICQDEQQQSKLVLKSIIQLANNGVSLDKQAVLYRSGHLIDGLETELIRQNVAFIKHGGIRYLELSHFKDFLALLRIVANQFDQLAWRRALSIVLDDDEQVEETCKRLRLGKKLAQPTKSFLNLPSIGSSDAMVNALQKSLLACEKSRLFADVLDHALQFCALVFPTRYANDAQLRLADLRRIIADGAALPQDDFIARFTLDAPMRFGNCDRNASQRLTLSTLHSAKGQQWDYVHSIHCCDRNIPHRLSISAHQLDQERQLLHVGLSRARKQLTVSYVVQPAGVHNPYEYSELSRFLSPVKKHFKVIDKTTPDVTKTPIDLRDQFTDHEAQKALLNMWDI